MINRAKQSFNKCLVFMKRHFFFTVVKYVALIYIFGSFHCCILLDHCICKDIKNCTDQDEFVVFVNITIFGIIYLIVTALFYYLILYLHKKIGQCCCNQNYERVESNIQIVDE